MVMARSGFVFLAMTKTGSTAVERAFARHADLVVRRPPRMKHANARTFDKVFRPVLEHYDQPRDSYEVVCVVREPVDWAHSWWRYRARPEAAGNAGWTGETSFEEFAEQIVSGQLRLGTAHNFVRTQAGRPPVDRVYRYEHLDQAIAWMAGRLGVDVPPVEKVNTSPRIDDPIAPTTRARLEEHFAKDVVLHLNAL